MTGGWMPVEWVSFARTVVPVAVILIPMAAAALLMAIGRRATPALPMAVAMALLLMAGLLVAAVAQAGPVRVALGGWVRPLGISLYADALSVTFLAMVAVVATVIALYACAAHRHPGARQGGGRDGEEKRGPYVFWPLLLFVWAGLNAVFLSGDLFNLYVALEVTGLAAVALVALDGGARALLAQMRYLLFATAGSLFYLFGVALIYAETGTLDLALAAETVAAGPAAAPAILVAAVLTSVGLLVKAAIWPLHFWLPQAHGSAPPAVSAILSALVVKAPLFLFLRLWFDLFAPVLPLAAWTVPGLLGAGAVLWGSVLAFRQRRLKLMIAYSTVAQLGYMLFVFPLAPVGGAVAAQAWAGAMLQIVSHGVAKASMFLAAGALVHAMGGDDRDRLRGATRRAPMAIFALALAGLSVIALPPSGGFLAKWMLLRASIEAGAWWLVVVLVVGGLLAAAYLFRFLLPAFEPVPAGRPDRTAATGWRDRSALFLALLSVALGLFSAPLIRFLGHGVAG